MRLGVRPEAHAAAFHALGEPPQIALEGVEIDDQCRGVDLIEAHANLGGRARRHRSSPALGTAAGLPMGWGNATRPAQAPAARLKAGAVICIPSARNIFDASMFLPRELQTREAIMGGLIYLIGLIVVILFILSFLGLR
jgi:hypothetical protein